MRDVVLAFGIAPDVEHRDRPHRVIDEPAGQARDRPSIQDGDADVPTEHLRMQQRGDRERGRHHRRGEYVEGPRRPGPGELAPRQDPQDDQTGDHQHHQPVARIGIDPKADHRPRQRPAPGRAAPGGPPEEKKCQVEKERDERGAVTEPAVVDGPERNRQQRRADQADAAPEEAAGQVMDGERRQPDDHRRQVEGDRFASHEGDADGIEPIDHALDAVAGSPRVDDLQAVLWHAQRVQAIRRDVGVQTGREGVQPKRPQDRGDNEDRQHADRCLGLPGCGPEPGYAVPSETFSVTWYSRYMPSMRRVCASSAGRTLNNSPTIG